MKRKFAAPAEVVERINDYVLVEHKKEHKIRFSKIIPDLYYQADQHEQRLDMISELMCFGVIDQFGLVPLGCLDFEPWASTVAMLEDTRFSSSIF